MAPPFGSDTFLFENILQQQGGFPTVNNNRGNSYRHHNSTNDLPEANQIRLSQRSSVSNIMSKTASPSSDDGTRSSNSLYDTLGSRRNSAAAAAALAASKRKYHNKSRNGCATCKKRRVKCDEGHPVCKKCENMKIECVYLPVEPKVRRRKKDILAERARKEQENTLQVQLPLQSPSQLQRPQLQMQTTPNGLLSVVSSSAMSDGFSPVVPAIKVNDYEMSSPTYSATTTASSHSKLGSMSSILSPHTPALPNDAVKSEFRSSDLFNMVQSSLPPELALAISAATAGGQQLPDSRTSLMLLLLLQQQLSQSNSDNPVTPQQIQKKIQQAQEYQKERAKKFQEYAAKTEPNLSPSVTSPTMAAPSLNGFNNSENLNMLDLRLMYHYTTKVWPTITLAGISEERIWSEDIPKLAFSYPFLMHSILLFSATHLSRTERGLDQCVTCHRGDALRLLREAVLEISPQNTDALVASLLILIMDSLANASLPTSTSPKSLPASAWIFHVKGAATILTAVWPLNESSRFYKFIGVDLGDLGDIINKKTRGQDISSPDLQDLQNEFGGNGYSLLECFDEEIADLYPVSYESPYLITLLYLDKLHNERYKSDFILRIFAFPALLDKVFLGLLITGDISAMRIMRSYYKLLRSFTTEMKDKVWFLEGVSSVLPVDVEQYAGGGGMHMMLDFLGGPSTLDVGGDEDLESYSELRNGLLNPDNLPSSVTNNMDVMQGDNDFM